MSDAVVEALFTAMSAAFTSGLEAAKPQWRTIASEVPSSGRSNYYGWMKDLPGIEEWVGDRQLASLDTHSYAVQNKTWESSVAISREDVEDDQIGQYSVIARKYGEDAALFPDKMAFGLLGLGFSELCFDGQPFFDVDHPVGGGTASNIIGDESAAGAPWFLLDTSKVLKPIIYQNRRPFVFKNLNPNEEFTWFNNQLVAGVDGRCNAGFGFWQTAVASKEPLVKSTYSAAVERLGSMEKDDGTPLGTRHTTLVVGYSNRDAGLRLLGRTVDQSNIYYKDAELVVSPYLA